MLVNTYVKSNPNFTYLIRFHQKSSNSQPLQLSDTLAETLANIYKYRDSEKPPVYKRVQQIKQNRKKDKMPP